MSVAWTTPVTNRSIADIRARNEKAFLNAGDMNRIESNIAYLSETLNLLFYPNQTQAKTDWDKQDIPAKDDIGRICGGISSIRDSFYTPAGYKDCSDLPDKALDYEDINLLEMNLRLLKMLLDQMRAGFKKASFKSGKNQALPKKL